MNKKGFTLVELLAVIVILAVLILIAITAILPQMEKARKSSFADEVELYAKAAETKYVSDQTSDENTTGNIVTGICYEIADDDESKALTGEYISKKDSAYSGIVIIKKKSSTSNQFEKFAYITNGKYYYNSSTTTTLPSEGVGKINTKTEVKDGGSTNLTFKKCCEFYDNCN